MVSSTVLSRSEPDRKVLFQTQSAAPQSRHAGYRGPVEGNRGFAQYGLPNRMYKLLCLLWICKYLNQRRSSSVTSQRGAEQISHARAEQKRRAMTYLIVALAVLARFIPHASNFSPVYGALL